jgi:hypothetical protein
MLANWKARARAWVRLRRLAAAAVLSLFSAARLWAQDTEGSGGTIVPASRSWIIEAVIVGAMVALALYAVCRASRRQ